MTADRLNLTTIPWANLGDFLAPALTITGPLFFAATSSFNEAFANLGDTHALILSMRGVPLMDTSGLEAVRRLYKRLHKQGGTLMFAGMHDNARTMMERGGLVEEIGAENFFWSSDQAIVEAEKRGCKFCEQQPN